MKRIISKIYLSGAITGHEEEAVKYFAEAERAVKDRFPCATVFNPINLPKLPSWEHYMVICRNRLKSWADTIVYIDNDYRLQSRGAIEEQEIATSKSLNEYTYSERTIKEGCK